MDTKNTDHTKHRLDGERAKKIIHILIGSKFYFDLNLVERHDLIRYILKKISIFFLKTNPTKFVAFSSSFCSQYYNTRSCFVK